MDESSKLIADLYAAFGRADIPYILERLSDDVQWGHSDSAEIPYGGSYSGKEAVTRFFGKIDGAVEMKSFEPRTYLASGDEVITTGVWSGVARATGKPFASQWAHRFLVKDGRVTYFQGFEDTAVIAAALRP
jgi:ketosteroid isomerase-like protein